jgi:hypothetical protein
MRDGDLPAEAIDHERLRVLSACSSPWSSTACGRPRGAFELLELCCAEHLRGQPHVAVHLEARACTITRHDAGALLARGAAARTSRSRLAQPHSGARAPRRCRTRAGESILARRKSSWVPTHDAPQAEHPRKRRRFKQGCGLPSETARPIEEYQSSNSCVSSHRTLPNRFGSKACRLPRCQSGWPKRLLM